LETKWLRRSETRFVSIVLDHTDELFDRRVLLVSAENPRGAPAFRDLVAEPPTSEREFISIWKLYFVSLIGRTIQEMGISNADAAALTEVLAANHLLPSNQTTLGAILATVRRYVAKMLNPKSAETAIGFDNSGMPNAWTGKIVFDEPDMEKQASGFLSVDDLLQKADRALNGSKFDAWIMIDRLDVAFDESTELEKNALRALFRTYRDIRSYDHIKLKIFLRTDIWTRITEEGFREATHMSRDIHLSWNKPSLQNLIVRRLLNNPEIVQLYQVDKEAVLASAAAQDAFFNRVFPNQVEVGEKQSVTIDWMLKRTSDGTNRTQPREIILFLNRLCEVQNQRLERGEQEPGAEWLFERSAFKEALPALSEYRVSRVLFAEYPHLRARIEALREQKTEQNVESLARLWKMTEDEALAVARELRDVGFFEERSSRGELTFWVPFVYRSFLAMSQGKVEEISGAEVEMEEA
jgi:hypothetical protein